MVATWVVRVQETNDRQMLEVAGRGAGGTGWGVVTAPARGASCCPSESC